MTYTYRNDYEEPPFVFESAELRPDLDADASWTRTGGPDEAPVTGTEGEDLVLARVSSPSGTPEESLSGGPFPTGRPDPALDVNVPSPEAAFANTAYADQVKVKPDVPSKFFDAGDGREASGIDLLGVKPESIHFQGAPESSVTPTYPATVESGLGSTPRELAHIYPEGSDQNPDGDTPAGDGVNPDAEEVAELEQQKADAASAAQAEQPPAAPESADAAPVVDEPAAPTSEPTPPAPPAPEVTVEETKTPAPIESGVQENGAPPVNPDEVTENEAPTGDGNGNPLEDGTEGAQGAHSTPGDSTTPRPAGNASTDEWLAAYQRKAGRAFPFSPDVEGDKPARADVISAFDALSEGAND